MVRLFSTIIIFMLLSCNKIDVIGVYNNKNCKLTIEKSKTSDSLKFKFLQVSEKCIDELEGDLLIKNSNAIYKNKAEDIDLEFNFKDKNSILIKDNSTYTRGVSCGDYNGKFTK